MPELLVSVRSAAEARMALAGGAGLIDVKDPDRGSLGRASDDVLAAVLAAVAGARPVSAALGELCEWPEDTLPPALDRLAFVKWGLAGAEDGWSARANRLRRRIEERSACRVALAAYADHARARAPAPAEVCRLGGFAVLLLDTFVKDGTSLLHWLTLPQVGELVAACRAAGARVALAGSLREGEIEAVLPLRPDWVAVRGAACAGGDRGATVDRARVRRLAAVVRAATPAG